MTQSTVTPAIANTDELISESTTGVVPQALNETAFEEFDLDDIEIIESKVFA